MDIVTLTHWSELHPQKCLKKSNVTAEKSKHIRLCFGVPRFFFCRFQNILQNRYEMGVVYGENPQSIRSSDYQRSWILFPKTEIKLYESPRFWSYPTMLLVLLATEAPINWVKTNGLGYPYFGTPQFDGEHDRSWLQWKQLATLLATVAPTQRLVSHVPLKQQFPFSSIPNSGVPYPTDPNH